MEFSKIPNIDFHSRAIAGLNDSVEAALEANNDIQMSKAAEIEKRGFVYQGDSSSGFGMRGLGFGAGGGTGFVGGSPFYGRGIELMLGNFSLQPFGVGGGIGGQIGGLSPSIFSTSGAGVAYRQTSQVAKMKMAMAVEAYKGFGIVKNVIDLMCNFASEGLTIVHPRPAVERFYKRWAEMTDLQGRVKDILRYYYKVGTVPVYTSMGTIDDSAYNKMKSTRGKALALDNNDPAAKKRVKDAQKESEKPIGKREIPWRYTILNPFQMEILGGKYFGEQEWVFVLDQKTSQEIKDKVGSGGTDFLDETDINLPPELKKLKKDDGDGRIVKLDQAKLWVFSYMKDDHEDWADPMIWPVMNDIMYKNSLRAMDMSVVNSTISAVTIFKLGDFKNGFIAPKAHFKAFSEMLRAPTYSHNIVWNDAISIESNYPPVEKILNIEKYRSVDKDILAGLGIPSILVDGSEGGSFSNAFLQVRTLLERLEEGRREVMKWITHQLRLVAETMGHRDIPIVRFGQMSLRDEQAEKQLIIQLLDRNIISAEAVHEVFGLDTRLEIERMRREDALAEDEALMIKHGPFKDPMSNLDEEDMMDKEMKMQDKQFDKELEIRKKESDINMQIKREQMHEQMKIKKEVMRKQQNQGINGRPKSGTKGIPQKKKRVTKPKGQSLGFVWSYEINKVAALELYEKVEDILTRMTLATRNLKYKKELSKDDKEALEYLTYAVFSHLHVDDEITEDYVLSFIESGLSVNDFVNALANERLSLFDGEPTAQDRRDIRAQALAMYCTREDD
jgi:hypothetical protein